MARYPLSLPQQLKQEAESWAKKQGISLNQFILWATAEKIGALNQNLDDNQFPQITYRRGASGIPMPVLRGTGIRVQSVAIAAERWELTASQIAGEYGISPRQVEAALAFWQAHRAEIETHIVREEQASYDEHG